MDTNQRTSPFFEMVITSPDGLPVVAASKPVASGDESGLAGFANTREEGQLSVDVLETEKDLVIVSTMAGAVSDNIQVVIHNDLITIRGERKPPIAEMEKGEYIYNECYWGVFSRTIVSPVHIAADFARAEYKNGLLTIRVPKKQANASVPILIVEE